MRQCLSVLPIGIVRCDDELRILSVDERFTGMFGDLGKEHLSEILQEGKQGLHRIHRAMASYVGDASGVGLFQIRSEAGAFLVRLYIGRDDTSWLVFIQNFERAEDVKNGLDTVERWKAILSASEDAIAVLDAVGRLVEFNSKFFELMRFRTERGVFLNEESLVLRDCTKLVYPEAFQNVIEAVQTRSLQPGERLESMIAHAGKLLDVRLINLSLPVRGWIGHMLVITDKTRDFEVEHLRLKSARDCGISEAATGVVHNVGNVLNSVKISAESLAETAKRSRIEQLEKAHRLIADNAANLTHFVSDDPRGKNLLEYLSRLDKTLQDERSGTVSEIGRILEKIDCAIEMIRSQQDMAKGLNLLEGVDLREAVEDVLRIKAPQLSAARVKIERRYPAGVLRCRAQRIKLAQVLINLVSNACEALQAVEGERRLTLVIGRAPGGNVCVSVTDNGDGVSSENKDKIFQNGFTTKSSGHGFGLHYCANALTEMGGKIRFHSDGTGLGTNFTLMLPEDDGANFLTEDRGEDSEDQTDGRLACP